MIYLHLCQREHSIGVSVSLVHGVKTKTSPNTCKSLHHTYLAEFTDTMGVALIVHTLQIADECHNNKNNIMHFLQQNLSDTLCTT